MSSSEPNLNHSPVRGKLSQGWMRDNNEELLHDVLGDLTPVEYGKFHAPENSINKAGGGQSYIPPSKTASSPAAAPGETVACKKAQARVAGKEHGVRYGAFDAAM